MEQHEHASPDRADDEVATLARVSADLAGLEESARERVLAYVIARHGKPKAPRASRPRSR